MFLTDDQNKVIIISLDSDSAPLNEIKQHYHKLGEYNLDCYSTLTVDITKGGYVDSSLIGQILKIHSKSKEHEISYNVVCTEEQYKVISLCSLHKLFNVTPSL